jgi:isocitrate dehydrogenase
MELLTCTCKHCKHRIKRQKKHGVSVLLIETRSIRRIVKQKLKHAVNHRLDEIEIPHKRYVTYQA